MRLSRYFLPILKETPKEAEIVSHRLMLRAGMIRQEAAGIYAWLPLGLRVLKKIEQIIREEQNRAGAIELLMPTIQSADLWRESGRYDDYGKEMLRIKDRHERDMLYGPTNEEMITEIFRAYVRSYKDLPLNLYHIQWKFRDEVRPRFGVMRGARVPDEGRLFLRHRRRGRAPLLQPDVRRLSAHLRAPGPDGDPDGRRHRPDRRRPQPRVHHPGRRPARARCSATGTTSTSRRRRRPSTSTTARRCRACSTNGRRSTPPPPRSTTRRRSTALPEASRMTARGIEVGHIFYFGTKYSKPMKAVVTGPDGREHAGPMRLLRHRREPAGGGYDRGEPRRGRHDLAGGGGAVRGRHRQPQGR